jgi:hypothetical protein
MSDFLKICIEGISKSVSQINAQEIGNALYGLQNLDSSVVSKEFIAALTEKIKASSAILDAQGI